MIVYVLAALAVEADNKEPHTPTATNNARLTLAFVTIISLCVQNGLIRIPSGVAEAREIFRPSHNGKYFAELSVGRACKYFPVVATEE